MSDTISSISSLAKLVGRSKVAVAQWVKREDWPFGPAPWATSALPEIRKWMADTLNPPRGKQPGAADEAENYSLKQKLEMKRIAATVRKTEEQIEALKNERLKFSNEYIPRAEVERMNVERIYAVKAELMNTARLVGMLEPFLVPGKLADAEAMMRKWVKGICDRFADAGGARDG